VGGTHVAHLVLPGIWSIPGDRVYPPYNTVRPRCTSNFSQVNITGDGTPLDLRVAACLMLRYGFPLSYILRLTAGDISRDHDGQVYIWPGGPLVIVPKTFAGLLPRLDRHGSAISLVCLSRPQAAAVPLLQNTSICTTPRARRIDSFGRQIGGYLRAVYRLRRHRA
jgi:hypothetical protein